MARYIEQVDWQDPVNWDSPLNRGLVSWWLAGENPYWGGSLFRDLCQRNHGTLTNGPTWQGASGRPGGWGSLSFDGNNDCVTVSNTASLEGMPTLTIAVWARQISGGAGSFGRLIEKNGTGVYVMLYHSINNTYEGYVNGTIVSSASGSAVLNKWQHVTMVYDGANIQLYVDGNPSGSAAALTGSVATNGNDVLIGNRPSLDRGFDGNIDNLKIYARALSASEVSALHHDSRTYCPSTLKYRRRTLIFDAGGGAPSFKSAWARNANSVWTVSAA